MAKMQNAGYSSIFQSWKYILRNCSILPSKISTFSFDKYVAVLAVTGSKSDHPVLAHNHRLSKIFPDN